ncbi:MAG: hypothetical protein A2V66_16760 [Ignavibacteria bacterium RBG_13_36_8]|nr:MAG: hypothetical protein A2V66_16760 [Ignavibacteria bacterium RBG_13_36_8]
MKPIKFKGSNIVFAENQPEYLSLPAHKAEGGTVTSCWGLTFRERIKILLKGKLYFSVLTFNQPLQPQLPSVNNPITKK